MPVVFGATRWPGSLQRMIERRQSENNPPGTPVETSQSMEVQRAHFFFRRLPGQQIGHGLGPRNLCPRLHVFHPPRLGFVFFMTGIPGARRAVEFC